MIQGHQPYRRRRALVAVAVTAAVGVVVLAVVGVVAIFGGDDDSGGSSTETPTTIELPSEPSLEVIDRLREDPCFLLASTEVQLATGRQATVNPGGPPNMCTYDVADAPDADAPAGDTVTVQASGPQSPQRFEATVAAGVEDVEGGGDPAFWLPGGGTGGRMLALKGAVVVEVGVRMSTVDEPELKRIGRHLIDQALARVPPNEPAAGTTDSEECPLVALEAVETVLGEGTLPLPVVHDGACSFRNGDRSMSVERITGNLPDIGQITRITSIDGEMREWPRTELDLIDGGVYLADPDESNGSGELFFRDGDVLFQVLVVGLDDPATDARRAALLLLD